MTVNTISQYLFLLLVNENSYSYWYSIIKFMALTQVLNYMMATAASCMDLITNLLITI